MRVDMGDACGQTLMQVRPEATLTAPAEMHIGDLNDFHDAFLILARTSGSVTGGIGGFGGQSAGSGTDALKTSRRVPVSDEKKCMSSGEIFRPTVLPGSGWTASDVITENGTPSRST